MTSISFVAQNAVESTSISSMPSHQAGDTLVMFAFRNTNNSAITVPSGWSVKLTNATNSRYSVCAYKIATSSAEVSGTWTLGEFLVCLVYREATNYLSIGSVTTANSASTTTPNFATTTGRTSGGTAINWFIGLIGVSLNSTAAETPPSGMTNRANVAGASTGEVSAHDTNGVSSAWSATTVTVSAEAYHSYVAELFDTGIPISSAPFIPMTHEGQEGVLAA